MEQARNVQMEKNEKGGPGKDKIVRVGIVIAVALALLFIGFVSGVKVGLHKAKFSYKWGENYERNFIGGPRLENKRMGLDAPGGPGKMGILRDKMDGLRRDLSGSDFRNPHGVAGEIVSIADMKIIVKDSDGKENTVSVTDKTIIKVFRDNLKFSDLKQGDRIVIMGRPSDDGVIMADFIRVFSVNSN